MVLHYEFLGDNLLPPETRDVLVQPDAFHEDIFGVLQEAADECSLSVGEPTLERWYRMLTWVQYIDTLSDTPSAGTTAQETCHEAIRALEPQPWDPKVVAFDAVSSSALHWGRIVRSSFEDGDVVNERREQLANVSHFLCQIGRHKMQVQSMGDYIAICRTEGTLVGDLFTGCLSDDERHKPAADVLQAWLRQIFRLNIVCDSAADYEEDIYAQRLAVPYSTGAHTRLIIASYAELGAFLCRAPLSASRFIARSI